MRRGWHGIAVLLVCAGVGRGALPASAHAEQAFAVMPGNVLIGFDTDSPETITTTTPITGLGSGQTVRGIDFRPATGELYGSAVPTLSTSSSLIFTYLIDPATGAASSVGTTGIAEPVAGDVPTGYDFNPTSDRIRYVNTNDGNLRINPNTGTLAGFDVDLSPAATTEIVAEAHDRNTPGGSPMATTLYAINRATSMLSVQGGINQMPSPNTGQITDLAPLGITLGPSDGGFDVSPGGTAYAALTANDGLTRLYTVNLVTTTSAAPVLTFAGVIGDGSTQVISLSIGGPSPPPKAGRTLTFDAAKNKIKKGKKVGLTGTLDAPANEAGCESGQTVDLQRQRGKSASQRGGGFTTFRQVQTSPTGSFSAKQKVKKTYTYRATIGETDACSGATSSTERVKAKKKKK